MTNPLSNNNNATWVGDGQQGATLTVDGSTISLASAKRGTPFNVMLDDNNVQATSDKSLYYQVQITALDKNQNLSVGVVAKDEFQPGWKTRGMFYNGNLTNGSAGLVIGFGERAQVGDTVGVLLQRDGSTCKVIFYLNDKCLGTGFAVATSGDKVYYPCLHLDGQATVQYTTPSDLPTVFEREKTTYNDPYSGQWLLEKILAGPELGEMPLPDQLSPTLTFSQTPNDTSSYRLSIKVGNTLGTSLQLTGEKLDNVFDKIQVNPGMVSTMMMNPPEIQNVETFLSHHVPQSYKMMAHDDTLLLTGPTSELQCRRYYKTFEPVTEYNRR